MKFKVVTWEEGRVNEQFCIMATIQCTPGWLAKIFGSKPYVIDCYGEYNPNVWQWYYVNTGAIIPHTTYADYDCWDAGKKLGDFLRNHKQHLDEQKRKRNMRSKIQKAVKGHEP
jgi:hypothetical protein